MANNNLIPYEDIYSEIKETLLLSRNQAYSAVNFAMVQAYWQIGRIIVEHEQNGNARAGYGVVQPFVQGFWQGLFCADVAADEEILCHIPKYERTAFAIDLDALPPFAVGGK